MAVYNGARFLREAIESVLRQTLRDLELIIVDDGSTDASGQILDEYASRDPRVVVRRQENRGRAAALNRGIAVARAPFVARLDADDVALPDRVKSQRRFLGAHVNVALAGGAVTFMDERGRSFADVQYPLTDAEIREAFSYTTPFSHPAVMFRRDAFLEVGGYRTLFVESEDLDLWLRLAERYQLANLPESVIRYRMHAGQTTVQHLELQTLCAVAARAAWRARLDGRPDPLGTALRIDCETLLAMGITASETTSAFVRDATWLAKTMARAGYADAAEALFSAAAERAASASGSPALVAHVRSGRALTDAKQGHALRSRLRTLTASFAGRWTAGFRQ